MSSDEHGIMKISAQIREWMKRLVDLSRRNRLLYFKSTRSSSARVIEPSMVEVFNRLLSENESWKFLEPPEENETERLREPDELKCETENTLDTVLVNLYRRAHSEYEERGIHILHMCFGMLKWNEQPQSDIISSPLLLLPVEIRRETVSEPYQLCQIEEDLILNPALKISIKNAFNVDLPEPEDIDDETRLLEYMSEVSRIAATLGFTVSDECWIGLFSFSKLPIYNDLKDNERLIINHPVTSALGGNGRVTCDEPIQPDTLDKTINIRQSNLVLDADSSQLSCIESIKEGNHLIVQGPPGTGKSQTIVNLIAEFVSSGKSVLFVSEKMAALDVVYKRLKDRGLGHLCLELHSGKANKRLVVEELYQCYQQHLEVPNDMPEADFMKLEKRREELNHYVSGLHQPHEPLGLSAYQALGKLVRLQSTPTVSPTIRAIGNLTTNDFDEAITLSKRLGSVWNVVSDGETFPWRGCNSTHYGVDLRSNLSAALTSCLAGVQDLQKKATEITQALGLQSPESQADLWFLDVATLLNQCPSVPRALLTYEDSYNGAATTQPNSQWEYTRIAKEYSKGIIEGTYPDKLLPLFLSQFRWFNPHFYSARAKIKQLRNDRKLPPNPVRDLKDAHELKNVLEWTSKFRSKWGTHELPNQLLTIVEKGSSAAPDFSNVFGALQTFNRQFESLGTYFEKEYSPIEQKRFNSSFATIQDHLKYMIEKIDLLRDWIEYKNIEKGFADLKLQSLFDGLVMLHTDPKFLQSIAEKSLLQSWVDKLFEKEPILGQFRSVKHEDTIAEFRELDKQQWKLGPYRVINRANQFKPAINTYPESESYVLQREALKKRRHLPLRKLFPQIANLLLRIKPCLLMSPLSVSQFINPASFHFDLVVFDEASQVRTEDAIGAIYRSKQLVVCGDEKQLPPTSFFEGLLSDEYYDRLEDDFAEYESILQASEVAGVNKSMLRWHYRSRHESLIAFSNHQFYADRLVTFPSAVEESPNLGIKFVYVSDGIYDRGGKRDNRLEAEKVIELLTKHFTESPDKSIGVVSFSISQASTIEDYIEKMRNEHPEFEQYFATNRLDNCFVKNLENVQGDERDVMIFSVGYARDQQGRLTMNFGPLNREGGERRLNVAITRAREKVYLVSSIKASDFNLSEVHTAGVLQLHKYLQYAEQGPKALTLEIPISSDFESPLEANIAQEIRKLGYDVKAQVGCSGYRIDLGVLDPQEPGRFILGVECDGATYHSAYTARDRDRIRQEALEKLGWRIHRIWAPDYVSRHDVEVKRLKDAIESARNAGVLQWTEEEKSKVDIRQTNAVPSNNRNWTTPYSVSKRSFSPPSHADFNDKWTLRQHRRLLKEIIADEAPIHVSIAARRLADAWGLKRIGPRMETTINETIRSLVRNGDAYRKGDFLWSATSQFQLSVRTPNPRDPVRTSRAINQIPPEEVKLAYVRLVEEALSIPREQLIIQVARIFGIERLTSESQQTLDQILRELQYQDEIREKEGRLTLRENTSVREKENTPKPNKRESVDFGARPHSPADSYIT